MGLDDDLEHIKMQVWLNFTVVLVFWGYDDLVVTCPVPCKHRFISKILSMCSCKVTDTIFKFLKIFFGRGRLVSQISHLHGSGKSRLQMSLKTSLNLTFSGKSRTKFITNQFHLPQIPKKSVQYFPHIAWIRRVTSYIFFGFGYFNKNEVRTPRSKQHEDNWSLMCIANSLKKLKSLLKNVC